MIKMVDLNDQNNIKYLNDEESKISSIKKKENMKGKKSITMGQIISENKRINININQNININSNIKEIGLSIDNKEKSSKPKTENSKLQKIQTSIMGFESEKIFKKNLVLSVPLSNRKSRDKESSYRMENLLEKKSKGESSYERQEQFFEFYINDNIRNKDYKLKDNYISTTKYNLFTFIPKGLLYQFCRLSNIYFLFTAIIQSIPLISPLTSLTAIIPLIFVLGVSLIREAIEDLARYNYDNLNNEEEVWVFRKNKFIKSTSRTLKHGEIILIYENINIPADIILIDSGFSEGTCYVETSSLDGEKTLKLKVANKYTQGFISNDIRANKGIEKFIQPNKYSFNGFIKINSPNADLNYINGTAHVIFSKNDLNIEEDVNLSINEFLLKGSILKNTNWIIGIVAYTGLNNKIILNSKKPRLKMSKIEKNLNYFLLFVFSFLMICCIICSLLHYVEYSSHKKFYSNFILISKSPQIESFICFFTYFLLLNTLIPISLIVSTEIIKIIQGIFIGWDILLYSKYRHCFCGVKSVSIIEELGNVNFIFSDKTGTLTKNQLEFKYCIIENKFYEYAKSYGIGNNHNSYGLLDHKIRGKNNFTHLQEPSGLNNSKVDLLSKLNINSSLDNNLLNNENEFKDNNITIYKSKKLSSNKIIPQIEYNYHSNQNISNKNKIERVERQKSKSLNKRPNIKNDSNNSNLSNNSHKSHKDSGNSHHLSNIDRQIRELKKQNKIDKKDRRKNSTILEINNEESFNSISKKNEIIIFGEGYFSNPSHNHILNNINLEKEPEFEYIHEFWKALAITNECMVKEEKGEIKYMGTSPDDLELVKAAMNQGYKLIETSINTKVVRIGGKDFSFQILKVLGFSSERKRMSIIIKDKYGIKLYIKGADSEISKRLSKKSLQSENYKIITNGLLEFSKKGFRTLMIAYHKIKNEDYNSWINKLHEDELNIQNKHKLLERLYDIIENNLTLIGGTVVEDKLQDKVPETIRELRAAGIKIWVLTGDKLDTAENIGHSCNLLSKEQKLFVLKVMPGDNEKIVKENPYREMTQFFNDFQSFVGELIKKYNLDSKYILYRKNKYGNSENNFNGSSLSYSGNESPNNYDRFSKRSNFSEKSQIIDFEIFKFLKDKSLLEPFSIIIEAPILCGLFKDEEWTQNFLHIAYYSNTVICCRVSPSQKSQVVQKMKNFDKNAITLAVGDGGNDVSMIMEANIGVGIHGEEGTSAVQASDFSIGEFQNLKRLLFIHGRANLYRISNMILYFFFKNVIFTMTQFYFAFHCLGSGQTFIDDWYITCYNLIFTAFPLCVSALTDCDIDLNDNNIKKNLPLIYKESRDNYRIFTFGRFIFTIFKGSVFSLLIYISCCIRQILTRKGHFANIWYISLKSYMCVLVVVSSNLLISNNFIAVYLPITIFVTTFLLFFSFLFLNHYGIFFEFNSKASIISSLQSSILYFTIVFILILSIVIDYSLKLFDLFFSYSLTSRIIFKNSLRKNGKKRKSISGINNLNSKSYSNNNNGNLNSNKNNNMKSKIIEKIKDRSSLNYFELSNNNLMSKSPNYILNSINKNDINLRQNLYLNEFNNDIFSLQFRNINKVLKYENQKNFKKIDT